MINMVKTLLLNLNLLHVFCRLIDSLELFIQ